MSQARQALTAALVARAKAQSNGGADRVQITRTRQSVGGFELAGTYRA